MIGAKDWSASVPLALSAEREQTINLTQDEFNQAFEIANAIFASGTLALQSVV